MIQKKEKCNIMDNTEKNSYVKKQITNALLSLLKEKELTSDKLISLIEIIKNDYNLEIITRLNLRKLKKNNVSDNILKEIKND